MSASVLIINGSARISGNTDIPIDRVIAGARNINLNPSIITLLDKYISNCMAAIIYLKHLDVHSVMT